MPLYEYKCNQCKSNFEKFLPLKKYDYPQNCPDCGGISKKQLSIGGIQDDHPVWLDGSIIRQLQDTDDPTIRPLSTRTEYNKYLKDNGWEKRAYFYIHDEPNTPENYEQIIEYGKVVREAVPEIRISVSEQTYPHEPTWPDIDPYIDIWCPLLGFIDKKTIDEKISQGDEVWSYSALCQRAPGYHPAYDYVKDFDQPYWQIDFPLTDYRVPMWINWQYNITGYLYWSTTSTVIDPWWNPAFRNRFNGDGYLFYPGKPCGIDGPVSSMRMKNLRDGMEDYDYFSILKDLGGKEAIDEIVNTIAPNWWDFSRDPEKYVSAREKLAEAILNAKR